MTAAAAELAELVGLVVPAEREAEPETEREIPEVAADPDPETDALPEAARVGNAV